MNFLENRLKNAEDTLFYAQNELEWDGTTYHYSGGTINGISFIVLLIIKKENFLK